MMSCEHAKETQTVAPRWRHQCCQSAHERHGVEYHCDLAVSPRTAEPVVVHGSRRVAGQNGPRAWPMVNEMAVIGAICSDSCVSCLAGCEPLAGRIQVVRVLGQGGLDEAWRRQHLPKVEAITAAVRARPSLAQVWARHIPTIAISHCQHD